MKIIFLDIDGVLNCVTSGSRSPSGFKGIDEDKVKLLRQIADKTGALIVLTSTWKSEWDIDPEACSPEGRYLSQKLRRQQLRILDKTMFMDKRGTGIRQWLAEHPKVTSWVVLDDDIFADYERQGILPHLVQTSYFQQGLTQEHVQKAIDILLSEEPL